MNTIKKVILKLNSLTRKEGIKWEIDDCIQSDSIFLKEKAEIIGLIYTTFVASKDIRLYRFKFSYKTWISYYCLELLTNKRKTAFEFPQDPSIDDLYESVRWITSGAGQFFEDFLKEE